MKCHRHRSPVYPRELWSLKPAKTLLISRQSVCVCDIEKTKVLCLVASHNLNARSLILYAAKQAERQRAMLLITVNCTFEWMWPFICLTAASFSLAPSCFYLSSKKNNNPKTLQVQLSAVTPPPTAPVVPSGLEDSLSGLSISTAPPTMPSELQTGILPSLSFTHMYDFQ